MTVGKNVVIHAGVRVRESIILDGAVIQVYYSLRFERGATVALGLGGNATLCDVGHDVKAQLYASTWRPLVEQNT